MIETNWHLFLHSVMMEGYKLIIDNTKHHQLILPVYQSVINLINLNQTHSFSLHSHSLHFTYSDLWSDDYSFVFRMQ